MTRRIAKVSEMSDTGYMETAKQQRNTPPRDLDAELGRRAHMLMWDAKLKQGQVATLIGMSSGSLGLKLKGQRGWALSEVAALADALNTTVAYLFGEETEKAPTPEGEGLKLPGLDSNQEPIGFKPLGIITPLRVAS